jgi:hypothetical protein
MRRNGSRAGNPYLTTARFDATPGETGRPLRTGKPATYDPHTRAAYCEARRFADQVRV